MLHRIRDPHVVRLVTTALLLAAWGALPRPAGAEWTAPPEDGLRRLAAERVERGGVAGVVIGVLAGGEPRVVGAGHRDGDGSPPPDGDTVFEIGSVSKVLTTTLLAEMVARGEVSLDDTVAKLLPESVRLPSGGAGEITLLDLATATSGLPRLPGNLAPADPADPYADYDAEDLHAFLAVYEPTREPGASYEYSNLGMGLLGHLLALRAETGYEELVRARILAPLGMDDTRIELTPGMRERFATGHGVDLEPVAPWHLSVLAGAGAWRSTAHDLLRFLAAALDPPDGPLGEALKATLGPRRPTGSPGLEIALGWHVLARDGREIVWHNGGTGGFHSFVGFDPESGAAVVVLANSAVDVDDLGLHVLDPTVPLRELPAPREAVPVGGEVLERYVGRYEVTPELAFEISRNGDALFVQLTGQPRFRLRAASSTRFFLQAVDAEIEFQVDEEGAATGLVLHQGGQDTGALRVP